jgi:hypothetical protein
MKNNQLLTRYLPAIIGLVFLQSCNALLPLIKEPYAKTLQNKERKAQIEIPELYEMMLVATALTDSSLIKLPLIDTSTDYYREVKTTFANYKNLPLVKRLNRAYNKKEFWQIASMAAINFQSSYYELGNGQLQDENRYKIAGFIKAAPTPILFFSKNKAVIEDFYQKTHFSDFYKAHKAYYDKLIMLTREGSGLDDMWQWLEVNFLARKQSYRVITSPLLGGSHNTIPLFTKDKKVSEMLCFVSTISNKSDGQRFQNQRMFLTEIDENYAHVPTQFLPVLKKSMNKNMVKWNSGKLDARHYKGVENTFNENFTHAVMACYGYDRYEAAVFEKQWAIWQNFMEKKRGFPSFKPFSDELLRLYKNRAKGQTVHDLFAPMVEWVVKNSDN